MDIKINTEDFSAVNKIFVQAFDNVYLSELKNDLEVYLTNSSIINKHKAFINKKDVIIFGSGSTVNNFMADDIRCDDLVKIAVNSQIFDTRRKYDFFFASDYKVLKRREITPAFLLNKINDGVRVCLGRNIHRYERWYKSGYYITDSYIEKLSGLADILYYTNIHSEVISKSYTNILYSFYSIGHIALLFSILCRANRVYLVGFDQGGNYADGTPRLNMEKTNLKAIDGFKRIRKIVKEFDLDTEIISINPVNMRGLFRDVYTDSYIKEFGNFAVENPQIICSL